MCGLRSKLAAFLLALGWCLLFGWNADQVVAEEGDAKPQVVYLHTEFLPHKKENKDRTSQLGRELARQALIIACEEELGVVVRDGSLDEAMPSDDDAEVVHLAVLLRNMTPKRKRIWVKLFRRSLDPKTNEPTPISDELWNSEPLWKHIYFSETKRHQIYLTAAPVLEQAARSDFVDALKLAGVRPAKKKAAQDVKDEQKLLTLSQGLMEADFVKLFGALRKIHGNVAETNNSAIRHGLLARGYAQLNSLTRHHYSSSEAAFAARALLFAERMVSAADGPAATMEALWHRAYVLSVIGLDIHAWSDLEQIRKIQDDVTGGDKDQASKFSKAERWKLLVEPFTKWDSQALIKVGDQHEELRPWSRRLAFQVIDGNRYPEKVLEAVTEFVSEIPADYGMYAEMAKYGGLQVPRTAASWGPAAFRQYLPESLDLLEDLPGDVKEFLPVDNQRRKFAQKVIPDLDLKARFTPLGAHISSELEDESKYDQTNGLSWSVLARLIQEEQFVQAGYVLEVAQNATESSMHGLVNQVLPSVSEHRYADYIRSYRYRTDTQTDQCWEHLKKIKVRDPSLKMASMIWRYHRCADRVDPELAKKFWSGIGLNYTTVDYNRRLFTTGPNGRETSKAYYSRKGKEFTTFTKFSEAGWRMCIRSGIDPDQEQLKRWEENIKKDSMAFCFLGQAYQAINLNVDAERCLKKSVDLLPALTNVETLAVHYFDQKDYKNWEQTCVDYLETDPIGLRGARIHQSLANGLMVQNMYQKALPHARIAGETHSGLGLQTVCELTEQLALWEESERWAQTLSTSYPSISGKYWYFWCRRNGRGDLAAARKVAATFEARSSKDHRSRIQWVKTAVFRLMEDDVDGALKAYRKALSYYMSYTMSIMISQLSRQLKDDASSSKALDDFLSDKAAGEDKEQWVDCAIAVARLAQSEHISDEQLAEIEKEMLKIRPIDVSTGAYFVGKELLIRGQKDKAKVWLKRSMRTRGLELSYYSLAGMELARLNGGTTRADDEVLSRKDMWPPEAEPQPEP